MKELDTARIQSEIKALAAVIKRGKPGNHTQLPIVRYTQLCALRATMRGKLHFCPRTNLELAHWIFGVPCRTGGATLPDGNYKYEYAPITLEIQQAWVEPLVGEFQLSLQNS